MKKIRLPALIRQRYTYQQCAHAHAHTQCHNSALLTLQVISKITSVAVLCEKDTNNCHENAGGNNIKYMLMKRYSASRIWNLSASSGNDDTFLRSCEKAAGRNATLRGGERKLHICCSLTVLKAVSDWSMQRSKMKLWYHCAMYINVLQKHTVVGEKKFLVHLWCTLLHPEAFFQAFLFSVLLPLLIKKLSLF